VGRFSRVDLKFRSILRRFETLVPRIGHIPKDIGSVLLFNNFMHILYGKIYCRSVGSESRVGPFCQMDICFRSILEQFGTLVPRIEHNIAVYESVFIFEGIYIGK
jgi:hypothetical protein